MNSKHVLLACLCAVASTPTVSASAPAPKTGDVCDRVASSKGVPPSIPGLHGAWTVYDCAADDAQGVCNVDVRLVRSGGRYVVDMPWLVTFDKNIKSIQWNFVATSDAPRWKFIRPVEVERNCLNPDDMGCSSDSFDLFGANPVNEKYVSITPKKRYWFRVTKYSLYIDIDGECVKWGPMVVNRGGD